MIFEHKTYADENERVVHAKIPIDDDGPTQFFGVGSTEVDATQIAGFEFGIAAETVEEAFAAYDDAMAIAKTEADKQVAKRKRDEQQEKSRPKIIRASNGVPRRFR